MTPAAFSPLARQAAVKTAPAGHSLDPLTLALAVVTVSEHPTLHGYTVTPHTKTVGMMRCLRGLHRGCSYHVSWPLLLLLLLSSL